MHFSVEEQESEAPPRTPTKPSTPQTDVLKRSASEAAISKRGGLLRKAAGPRNLFQPLDGKFHSDVTSHPRPSWRVNANPVGHLPPKERIDSRPISQQRLMV